MTAFFIRTCSNCIIMIEAMNATLIGLIIAVVPASVMNVSAAENKARVSPILASPEAMSLYSLFVFKVSKVMKADTVSQ